MMLLTYALWYALLLAAGFAWGCVLGQCIINRRHARWQQEQRLTERIAAENSMSLAEYERWYFDLDPDRE